MKKILSYIATFVIAILLFFAKNNVIKGNNLDLKSLASLNSANAECNANMDPTWNSGRCNSWGECWAQSGNQCDPYYTGF